MDVANSIKEYLRTLAPHVKRREAAVLLQLSVDELERRDWVSVEAGLPDVSGSYLVYDKHLGVAWGFFNSNKQWANGNEFMEDVTDWQPLPPAPSKY